METNEYTVKGLIEIGSRGIRLLVAEKRDNNVHYIYSLGEQLNLGDLDDGILPSTQKLVQAADLVLEFRRVIKTFAATDMIIATEIMRNPLVLQKFLSIFKMKVPVSNSIPPIVVLDKKIEAYYAFSSVIKHFKRDFRKPVLVVDMGGGSTEFAVGKSQDSKPEILFTLSDKDISSLNFYRKFQNSNDKMQAWTYIKQFIDNKIDDIYLKIQEHNAIELIALGSSAIDLSRLQIQLSTGEAFTSSSTGLTEVEVGNKFLKKNIQLDFNNNIQEKDFRMQFGMYFFSRFLDKLALPSISICGHGLRYSIIHDWLFGRFNPAK